MTHTFMCQGSIPSCWNSGEAHHIVNEPFLEEEDLFCRRKKQQVYQRYIFLQATGGPSVCISKHMVHERVETRIDQSNINI